MLCLVEAPQLLNDSVSAADLFCYFMVIRSEFIMNNVVNLILVLISVLMVVFSTGSAQVYSSQNDLAIQRLNKPATVLVQRPNLPSTARQWFQDSPNPLSAVPTPMYHRIDEGVTGHLNTPLLPLFRPGDQIHSVSVTCHPTTMELRIKSDLFQTGFPVKPEDLRLGPGGSGCGVEVTPDHFIIQVPLTDCNTHYWVTENALVYSNLLVYSPTPSPEGLIRSEVVTVPVECRYSRRFGVDSDLVAPAWIPHQSAYSAQQSLQFSLHLMSRDWRGGRESSVYFLGDVINMEASVFTSQMELKVYIESCVATTSPEIHSLPSYKFIDNGCFTDGGQVGSRSRFLPRMHLNKLQLELDAFVFHQVDSSQIYISCVLRANLLNHLSSSTNRACSFINNRWRSADRDGVCEVCQGGDLMQVNPELPAKLNREGSDELSVTHLDPSADSVPVESAVSRLRTSGNSWINTAGPLNDNRVKEKLDLRQEASVGPLSLATRRNERVMTSPPIIRDRVRVASPNMNISRRIKGNDPHSLTETDIMKTTVSESDAAEMFSTPEPGLINQLFKIQPPVLDVMIQPPPETLVDAGTHWNRLENTVDLDLPVGASSLHLALNPTQQMINDESATLNSVPVHALQPQSDPAWV